jgi:hypothetical protein
LVSAVETEAGIRTWAATRRLPDAHLARWLALAETDRTTLLNLAEGLGLRTGQFITAFEMLEEIAVREREGIGGILARAGIRRILDGTGSGPGKARAFIDELRAIRFPRLKKAADRMAAEVAAMSLPRGIKVILPRNLGSDEVRIEIVARGGAELGKLIEAVARNEAGLRRIAEMIGGMDEL